MEGAGWLLLAAALFAAESTFAEDASRFFVDITKIPFPPRKRQHEPINQGFERTQALGGSSEFMRGMRRLL